jgi:hypothetical protein
MRASSQGFWMFAILEGFLRKAGRHRQGFLLPCMRWNVQKLGDW